MGTAVGVFEGFLVIIGLYALAVWLYDTISSPLGICWGLLKQCIRGPDDFTKRYGKWAVIIGGSDGIGRQFALYLAKKGLNIALLALPDDYLDSTAREIETNFGVKVKQVPIDFGGGFEVHDYIRNEIGDLDIGILGSFTLPFTINNVGTGPKFGANFDTFSLEFHQKLINVNIVASIVLSHIALPGMKQRGRGLVVNVSSVFGLTPVPNVLICGATKAFVYSFSEALRVELKPYGIGCQTITPHLVKTKLTEHIFKSSIEKVYGVEVDNYGKFLTMTLGKTTQTTGHWKHAILITLQKFVNPLMPKVYHKFEKIVMREQKLMSV